MVVHFSGRWRGVVGAKVWAALRFGGGESDLELFPVIVREAFYRDALHPANDVVTLIAHTENDFAAVLTIGDIWCPAHQVRRLNIG